MLRSSIFAQFASIFLLVIQAGILPHLVGVENFGYSIFLLSVSFICQGLYEPICHLVILGRKGTCIISTSEFARDTVIFAIFSSMLSFLFSLQFSNYSIAIIISLQSFFYILLTITQSYMIKVDRYRILPAISLASTLIACFTFFLHCKLLVVFFNFVYIISSIIITFSIFFLTTDKMLCLKNISFNIDFKNYSEKILYYMNSLATRIVYIMISSGVIFCSGLSGTYNDISIYKLINSMMNSGRYVSPFTPAFFLKKINSGNDKQFSPILLLVFINAVWIVYSVFIFFLFPYIWKIIYSTTWSGNQKILLLLTSLYLSLQFLLYIITSHVHNKFLGLKLIAVNMLLVIMCGLLVVFTSIWLAVSLIIILSFILFLTILIKYYYIETNF